MRPGPATSRNVSRLRRHGVRTTTPRTPGRSSARRQSERCPLVSLSVSKAHADPQTEHVGGTAVAVVAGVLDVLVVGRDVDIAKQLPVVVDLQDPLEAVGEPAVAEDKAGPAPLEIVSMLGGEPVERIRDPHPVSRAPPVRPAELYADAREAIDFGECEALGLAVVVAQSEEDSSFPGIGQRLL